MVELPIAGEQRQIMLYRQGSDPQIIRRNGRTRLAKLGIQACIEMRRAFIGIQYGYTWRLKEACEDTLIAS